MKLLINIYLFISIVGQCTVTLAHQDTLIENINGKLIGLPKMYLPSLFDLENRILIISENKVEFPDCVTKYFPENSNYTLQISSSWYHSESILPPYITFVIEPINKPYSYNLTFNLETFDPMLFLKKVKIKKGVIQNEELNIEQSCRDQIQDDRVNNNNKTT